MFVVRVGMSCMFIYYPYVNRALHIYLYTSCVRVHVHVHNSYLTVIVVHGMHARMHHNHCQITILLAHDELSSSVYPMVIHPSPVADNLPIIESVDSISRDGPDCSYM